MTSERDASAEAWRDAFEDECSRIDECPECGLLNYAGALRCMCCAHDLTAGDDE